MLTSRLQTASLFDRLSIALASKLPFYGYFIVLLAIAAQWGSSPGQTYAISVFTPHLEADLGLSKSALSTAYMLGTFLAAIPLTLVGPLSDRFGIRATCVVVTALLGVTCCAASLASGFYSILAVFLLLRFLGQGAMTLLAGNMVSMWFQVRLGTMNAIMCAGSAAAFAVVPIWLGELIEDFDWQTAFLVEGGVLLVGLLPAIALLYRNHPADLGQHLDRKEAQATQPAPSPAADQKTKPEAPTEKASPAEVAVADQTLTEAMRHRTFWILAADMCFWAAFGTGVVFHSQAIFADLGVPSSTARFMFPVFSASMLIAQLGGGPLADRLPMHYLLSAAFAALAAGVLSIPLLSGSSSVYGFAVLFGGGQGLAIAVTATMWARYYGRKHLGKIRGAIWSLTVAGSGSGPLVLGMIADRTGSFSLGIWLFGFCLLPLVALSLFATKPSRRI